MSEVKLNILSRLKLIWEITTTRSGHKHALSSKQLSTFEAGYYVGVEDEKYNNICLQTKLKASEAEAKKAFMEALKVTDEEFNNVHLTIGCSESDGDAVKEHLWEEYKLKEQAK